MLPVSISGAARGMQQVDEMTKKICFFFSMTRTQIDVTSQTRLGCCAPLSTSVASEHTNTPRAKNLAAPPFLFYLISFSPLFLGVYATEYNDGDVGQKI